MTTPRPDSRTRLPMPTQRHLEPVEVAGLVTALRGCRVVLVNEQGSHHGWIVWGTALREGPGGWLVVDVVSESDWWLWVHTRKAPQRVLTWPAGAAAVETP